MFVCYLFLFLSILIVLLLFVWQGNTTLEMGLFWREFFFFLIERRILLSLYAFSHTIFLKDCFLHHKKDKNSWYEKNRGSLLVFPSFRWITVKLVKDMKKRKFHWEYSFLIFKPEPLLYTDKTSEMSAIDDWQNDAEESVNKLESTVKNLVEETDKILKRQLLKEANQAVFRTRLSGPSGARLSTAYSLFSS